MFQSGLFEEKELGTTDKAVSNSFIPEVHALRLGGSLGSGASADAKEISFSFGQFHQVRDGLIGSFVVGSLDVDCPGGRVNIEEKDTLQVEMDGTAALGLKSIVLCGLEEIHFEGG